MKLVILASGRGSRLSKLTAKSPKCLVKINHKSILSYLEPSFKFFDEIIIITGYRSNMIKSEFNEKFTYVQNKKYMKTNMVHSLFCASDLVNDDVIISYSDIIFDTKIISKLLKCNNSTIPLNYNWLNLWKMRMSKRDIINDAEDVKVKGKKIISIGSKINKDNIPNMQFMGLMKINEIDFFKMKKKYDELKKPNIDFTTFINLLIKSNVVDIEYIKSKLFWTEIDSFRDFVVAEKLIKNVDKI